ncbi:alpha/beta hydrolase [Herbaspirillum sp.]|uniref:alpha/beta hydrolase n=1 Tax=Herbaspirillum sp. TaxID=1890675 RepID=UPI0025C15D20|nr:alpha/beta hydrolase [Herbaspirillum sp.]
MKIPRVLPAVSLALCLAACGALPSAAERREAAQALASQHGWQQERIAAGGFDLVAWRPARYAGSAPGADDERLTVYIEGDGLAWLNSSQPSDDPTPGNAMALKLALAQPRGNAAYLARPCQFTGTAAAGCDPAYWTGRRFAEEVVAATDQAIGILKRQAGARRLALVGYSGGGGIAALVAARRRDVDLLVTVAGNLDHRAWTALHHVSPLTGSLNPADAADRLLQVRQRHFVGGKDAVMPVAIATAYAERYPPGQRPEVRLEPGFDHRCCWVEAWPGLWRGLGD